MRFVIVRHGESENNKLLAEGGPLAERKADPLLTPLGQKQASQLATFVASGGLPWQVTHLYSSLMSRAIQTAAPLSDLLGLPLVAHAELFECQGPYVAAEGATRRERHRGSPRSVLQALCRRLELPDSATEEGWWTGEFEDDKALYLARAHRVIADLRARHHDGDVVLLVTHGWFIQFILRELLAVSEMTGWVRHGQHRDRAGARGQDGRVGRHRHGHATELDTAPERRARDRVGVLKMSAPPTRSTRVHLPKDC